MKAVLPGLGWIICAIVLRSGADLVSKFAALSAPSSAPISIFASPLFVTSFVLLTAQALTWTMALRVTPLSVAYPIMSLTLPLTVFGSWFFLSEPIGLFQITGVIIIAAGVTLVTYRESN